MANALRYPIDRRPVCSADRRLPRRATKACRHVDRARQRTPADLTRGAAARHLQPFAKTSSQTNTFADDICPCNVTRALQIFGGQAYSNEFDIEPRCRSFNAQQIWDDTKQIQRMNNARHLKKEIA
jgi:alkylation response protein AidB-like acyl-CoA dehydrogenase